MKKLDTLTYSLVVSLVASICMLLPNQSFAQDHNEDTVIQISIHSRPLQRIGNTFESIWLIDNQTTQVPLKKTMELDILHRFGTVQNGYSDLLGLYAPSNIRIGFGYVPLDNFMVGVGFTKEKLLWDLNYKYALIKERGAKPAPVSVTYFGNVAADTRSEDNFTKTSDRFSYFNQLMVSKKVTRDFSAQISLNHSHMNVVEAYINDANEQVAKMKNDHLSFSVLARYKISSATAFIADFDQPITNHHMNNPYPNISAGVEIATPLHAFQVFAGNYQSIVPQFNNVHNSFNYADGAFLFGFNITRLLDAQEEDLIEMMLKRY
ncbi:MAG: hypothetical protein KJP21_06915 [Bacteroidia bacterium]|nr:hypothetical protein [Bacteroidia bacterium]NNJ56305.1 hypothetical protein [Bacteroidia bacterium]